MIRIRQVPTFECFNAPHANRSGATLTEVLMSILVMGIGVLSVITLFPASFLRTLQATNITQSTILRYNADALIDLDRTNRATVFAEWQPNTAYPPNAIVVSSTASGVYNRRFVLDATGGTSGNSEPIWLTNVGDATPDNGMNWTCEDHSRYVIDPLGWNTLQPAGFGNIFGNNGAATFVPAPPRLPLERFNANANSQLLADSLAMLPDSWTFQLQSLATGHTDTSVTLPASVVLTTVSHYDPTILGVTPVPPSHVILTDSSGRVSHTRWINSIAGTTINWSAAEPIPTSFDPVEVRIETQERRYTYLLTVRRTSTFPSVEVAAFFRRSPSLEDERVFNVSNINNRDLVIDHTGDGKAPFVKKGGYLLDVDTARWYRIQDSTEWGAGTQTRVTLDKAPIDPIVSVIIPRGIVDVFPIAVE